MVDGWLVTRDGRTKHGPLALKKLKEMADFGQLQPSDMVLQPGATTWVPASSLAELFIAALPIATPVPSPTARIVYAPDAASKGRRTRGGLPWHTVRFSVILGGILFGIGLIATVLYWNMDTTVAVEPMNFGGHRVGGGRIYNLGLMEERRTGLMISIAVAALGFGIVAVGTRRRSIS